MNAGTHIAKSAATHALLNAQHMCARRTLVQHARQFVAFIRSSILCAFGYLAAKMQRVHTGSLRCAAPLGASTRLCVRQQRRLQRTSLSGHDRRSGGDSASDRRATHCAASPSTVLSSVQAFVVDNATTLAYVAGAAVLVTVIFKILKQGSRKYDGNVGDEYDAWTREGILEHYWGEHIHLGYYSEEERQPGFFAWGKKDFKQVRLSAPHCRHASVLIKQRTRAARLPRDALWSLKPQRCSLRAITLQAALSSPPRQSPWQ